MLVHQEALFTTHIPRQTSPLWRQQARRIVKFESATEEVNIMKSHDEPISRKKKGKRQDRKSKSDQAYADPSEDGRNCGLDHINLWEPAQDSKNDSKRLFVQSRERQRGKNRNNSIKRESNVLSNFLNPTESAKSKNSHYSPILQGCMNNRSGKATF